MVRPDLFHQILRHSLSYFFIAIKLALYLKPFGQGKKLISNFTCDLLLVIPIKTDDSELICLMHHKPEVSTIKGKREG